MKFLTKSPISHTSNYIFRKMLTTNGLIIQKGIFFPIAGSKFRLSPFTLHPTSHLPQLYLIHALVMPYPCRIHATPLGKLQPCLSHTLTMP